MNRKEFGGRGEKVAEDYLKANGFKIVKRNFRCKMGEIDLIVKKGGELYFVEVKTRRDTRFGDPLESITLNKQRQIIKIAKYFLINRKNIGPCHFSALGIILDGDGEDSIKFIPDAFHL